MATSRMLLVRVCFLFASIGLASGGYCYSSVAYTAYRSTRSTHCCGFCCCVSRCSSYSTVAYTAYYQASFCCPGYTGLNCEVRIGSSFCDVGANYTARKEISGTRGCGWYNTKLCSYMFYAIETRYGTQQGCCSGFKGSRCDIPVCTPHCKQNAACIDTNKCYCKEGISAATCSISACSATADCYPGTCNTGSSCTCSSGFQGLNCDNIRDGGSFEYSRAAINNDHSNGNAYIAPNGNIYTNITELLNLTLEWQATYRPPADIPPQPNYILMYNPGITDTYCNIRLKDNSRRTLYLSTGQCEGGKMGNTTVVCRTVLNSIEPNITRHNYTLEVTFTARTGGYKTVTHLSNINAVNRTYSGNSYTSSPITIVFDLEKPQHCSRASLPRCNYEDAPALAIFPDNRQDTTTNIQIFGWYDDDSFVKEYKLKMFRLSYDSVARKLKQTGNSMMDETWVPHNELPEISYESGVYSIIMEIYDNAGNMAKARTVFLAEQENHVKYLSTGYLSVNGSQETTLGFWITDRGVVTINWNKLFANPTHVSNNYYAPIQEDDSIDFDDYIFMEGNRTIEAVEHVLGITRFKLGWTILPSNNFTWYDIQEVTGALALYNLVRNDGDTFNFTLIGYDRTDFFQEHHFLVHVDSSPPNVTTDPVFEMNIENANANGFAFSSRLQVDVEDHESGIAKINFTVYIEEHNDTRLIVANKTQEVKLHSILRQTECSSDDNCYCIKSSSCFDIQQYFWINHCWFVGETDHTSRRRILIEYSPQNYAGLTHKPATFLSEELTLSELSGIDFYPVPENVSVTRGSGNEIRITWDNPPSCYPASQIVFRYIEDSKERIIELPGNTTSHTITNVKPRTKFEVKIQPVYNDGHKPMTGSFALSVAGISLSGGAIAGIIIALLVVLVAVAASVFIFKRYPKARVHFQNIGPKTKAHFQNIGPRAKAHFQNIGPKTKAHFQNIVPKTKAHFQNIGPRAKAHFQNIGPKTKAHFQNLKARMHPVFNSIMTKATPNFEVKFESHENENDSDSKPDYATMVHTIDVVADEKDAQVKGYDTCGSNETATNQEYNYVDGPNDVQGGDDGTCALYSNMKIVK